MQAPNPERIQELLDKQDIRETVMRYVRGVDRCDRKLLASAFHPDAAIDHVGPKLRGDQIADFVIDRNLANNRSHIHHITSHLAVVEGDAAWSESYFLASCVTNKGMLVEFNGRYLDRFERRSGSWRIAARNVVVERTSISPFEEGGLAPDSVRPHRSKNDPSYSILEQQADPAE